MLYTGGKKLRNRVKLSTKVKMCVPNLAVVRRFDCIVSEGLVKIFEKVSKEPHCLLYIYYIIFLNIRSNIHYWMLGSSTINQALLYRAIGVIEHNEHNLKVVG